MGGITEIVVVEYNPCSSSSVNGLSSDSLSDAKTSQKDNVGHRSYREDRCDKLWGPYMRVVDIVRDMVEVPAPLCIGGSVEKLASVRVITVSNSLHRSVWNPHEHDQVIIEFSGFIHSWQSTQRRLHTITRKVFLRMCKSRFDVLFENKELH